MLIALFVYGFCVFAMVLLLVWLRIERKRIIEAARDDKGGYPLITMLINRNLKEIRNGIIIGSLLAFVTLTALLYALYWLLI